MLVFRLFALGSIATLSLALHCITGGLISEGFQAPLLTSFRLGLANEKLRQQTGGRQGPGFISLALALLALALWLWLNVPHASVPIGWPSSRSPETPPSSVFPPALAIPGRANGDANTLHHPTMPIWTFSFSNSFRLVPQVKYPLFNFLCLLDWTLRRSLKIQKILNRQSKNKTKQKILCRDDSTTTVQSEEK